MHAQTLIQDNFNAAGQSPTVYVPGQSYWTGRGPATAAPTITANAATGSNALTIKTDSGGPYGYWTALDSVATGSANGVSLSLGQSLTMSFSLTKLTAADWSKTGVSFGLMGGGTWDGRTQHPTSKIDSTKGYAFSLGSGANVGGELRSVTNGIGTAGGSYSTLGSLSTGVLPTGAALSTDLTFSITNVDGANYVLSLTQDGVVLGSATTDSSFIGSFQYAGFGVANGTAANFQVDNFSVSVVPEPSTYGLMGAGALGALALVRRRKRAA